MGISRIAMYWYKGPGSQRVYTRRRVQALVCPPTVDSFEHVHTEASSGTREGEKEICMTGLYEPPRGTTVYDRRCWQSRVLECQRV